MGEPGSVGWALSGAPMGVAAGVCGVGAGLRSQEVIIPRNAKALSRIVARAVELEGRVAEPKDRLVDFHGRRSSPFLCRHRCGGFT